jgi:hypothetical protein
MTKHEATVEVLTAEVRVLMVGSRQITLSVARQLDQADPAEIQPFGRVAPKGSQPGYVYVIGKHAGTGALVRARTPVRPDEIIYAAQVAADKAETAAAYAARCGQLTALAKAWSELPLIVLGLR